MARVLRCGRCAERAVYTRRYSGQRFCREHFLSYFEAKARQTIRKGRMLRKGDVVAVGVSGGKDSLSTLSLLHKLGRGLGIELHGIAVDEGIAGYRKETLNAAESSCSSLGVPLSIVSFKDSYGFTLDTALDKGGARACTYCGVLRRKLLNERALELGADKLATGHNLDDEVQAIMMNYISGDIARVARYTAEGEVEGLVKRIKPLGEVPEKEVALYAILMDLGASFHECPYAGGSRRTTVRSWLNAMEEGSPGVKYSVLRGYSKLQPYLSEVGLKEVTRCVRCGDPSAGETCRACSLVEEIIKNSE